MKTTLFDEKEIQPSKICYIEIKKCNDKTIATEIAKSRIDNHTEADIDEILYINGRDYRSCCEIIETLKKVDYFTGLESYISKMLIEEITMNNKLQSSHIDFVKKDTNILFYPICRDIFLDICEIILDYVSKNLDKFPNLSGYTKESLQVEDIENRSLLFAFQDVMSVVFEVKLTRNIYIKEEQVEDIEDYL